MTGELGVWGGLLGTVLGAGLVLIAMDVLFNKTTGKYYQKSTGKEISKEEAEQKMKSQEKLTHIF
jgi:cell division protein FtsX